jgi:hypothetical protein
MVPFSLRVKLPKLASYPLVCKLPPLKVKAVVLLTKLEPPKTRFPELIFIPVLLADLFKVKLPVPVCSNMVPVSDDPASKVKLVEVVLIRALDINKSPLI